MLVFRLDLIQNSLFWRKIASSAISCALLPDEGKDSKVGVELTFHCQ